jgi:hypothetical protein
MGACSAESLYEECGKAAPDRRRLQAHAEEVEKELVRVQVNMAETTTVFSFSRSWSVHRTIFTLPKSYRPGEME